MIRKVIFWTLVWVAPVQVFSQKIDSALAEQTEELIQIANQYLYSNTDTAKLLAEKALQMAEGNSYSFGKANAYNILGVVYDLNGEFGQSFSYHKQAIDLYQEVGNGRGMANSQANMSVLLKQHGRYEEALGYMESSSAFYFQDQDTIRACASLISIGNLLSELGEDIEVVQAKFDEALVGLQAVQDTAYMCSAWNAKAESYAKHGLRSEAILFYQQAVELAQQANRPFNLGYSYAGLARVFLDGKETVQAMEYNRLAVTEYEKIHYRYGILDLLEQQVGIQELAHDFEMALGIMRTYQALKDSLYNEKQSQQINQLEVQYETEKKQAEITALSQQAAIQRLEIQQKNQWLILAVVLFVFLAATVFLTIRQRDSRRVAVQTELEHRFLRSQLNPHFIFNALVSVQSYLFQKDTTQAVFYLTKFSKLMRQILENSRQEFIPLEQELSMLTNYLDLHQLRLERAFEYGIRLAPEVDPQHEMIPPMFVQPFVENAIEHGVLNLKKGGLIEINFKKEGDFISIEILDNGVGIQETTIGGTSKSSLSTTIIKERMDLFNRNLRNKINLVVDNRTDENGQVRGTRVELMVPFQRG